MWYLERELRKSGDPRDYERAKIISVLRSERGVDIPLPGADKEIYLFPRKEKLPVLTDELASKVKAAVELCDDKTLLEVMRYPLVEKRRYWTKKLPLPPEPWLDFYVTMKVSEKRFVSQAFHYANLYISQPATYYLTDPALSEANLGNLRNVAIRGDLKIPQSDTCALFGFVFKDLAPQV